MHPTQYRIFIGENHMVTTKKATTRKKPAKKPAVDWLGRPIKRATKAYGSKTAKPPRARTSTTKRASTRARKKASK